MHVSSLWGDYSEGAFGDEALEWIDFLADAGFRYWQVLPFCLPDEANSPYKSYSAFSLNPAFIDLRRLFRAGLLTSEELRAARQRVGWACEFDRLNLERMALLEKAARRQGSTPESEAFFEAHPHSALFCRFMALRKANGDRPWQTWDVTEPDPDTEALWRFTQYTAYTQWMEVRRYAASRGVAVIGDIPIYVAPDSSDVWANPDEFLLDEKGYPSMEAGVPPDYFCAEGQLWGNPLYRWDRMEASGFAWWKDRMRFMTELFDGVRIDHFRGLQAYYAIPAGAPNAIGGEWRPGPGMKLIHALKPLCEGKLIIAEDLGDITDDVRALVRESGFPGMRVLQFAFLGDENSPHLPHNYPENSVAYTGTHDNNTLLGYVWELDDETRRKVMDYCGYEGENWDACYDSLLRTMFASHAGTLILPVQDLLLFGRDTRLNTPGRPEGNWSYRVTAEQFRNVDRAKFRRWNRMYARTPDEARK